MLLSKSQRQQFQTKQASILTLLTIALLVCLSVFYNSSSNGSNDNDRIVDTVESHGDSYDEGVVGRWLEQQNDDDGGGGGGDDDYSRFSCRYIYEQVPESGPSQCTFAKTCNGGDGVWGAWVFCAAANSNTLNVYTIFGLMSPILILWMVTLFRLLGSTAEDFFSPSLEMFSIKLGLPPRFAGVTLLALGNGAADVSATMSAIVNDEENGYKLSLGALTGAAMLVGGVVSGVVILVADGVRCRGALVRDVMALAVTIAIVWTNLSSGIISSSTTTLFLCLYGFFVLTVLVADVYHRAVVLPRLAALAEAEANGLDAPVTTAEPSNPLTQFISAFSNYDLPCQNDTTVPTDDDMMAEGTASTELAQSQAPSSNGTPVPAATSEPSTAEVPQIQPQNQPTAGTPMDDHIILHGQHGILHGDGQVPLSATDSAFLAAREQNPAFVGGADGDGAAVGDSTAMPPNASDGGPVPGPHGAGWTGLMESGTGGGVYSLVEDHMDNLCVGNGASSGLIGPDGAPTSSIGIPASNWSGAWHDGKGEVKASFTQLWDDIAYDGDLKIHDRLLMLCELPFTIFRTATIPIPCEGYYNRGVIALSIAVSPFWFAWYMLGHEINLFSGESIGYFMIYVGVAFAIAALVLRFAPGGDGVMNILIETPIALYGFIMAATWIDYVADHLVSLLDFVGIVLHIPGSIMGLTVLAWGNSMGDLSANMTMARKGLANMAMTACFAGPVFNILVGLGLGFSNLHNQTGKEETPVELSAPILTGFVFVVINCLAIVATGIFVGKGRIEPWYGYIAVGLYITYVVISILLEFKGGNQ